jgi:hypothetical protein
MTSSAGTLPAPRGVPATPIHERQLDPRMVRLQRAAAASHQRGQLVESIRAGAAVLLAAAGIVVTLTGHGRPAMSITGAAWFLISAFLLKRAAGTTARQGALLQEMFDTALFYLPWRSAVAGDPVPEPDVHHLARRLRQGGAKDQRITAGWYDSTEGVHHPYDVLMAQEQNLGWDARLRRRYASLILAAVVIEFSLTGSSARRDAQVRHAITRLIRYTRRHRIGAIAVEDLNFADARTAGRETMGRGQRGKRFRRTVAGIPTAVFRARLTAQTSRHSISLWAVNPAYTSAWGDQHWRKPYQDVTRHEAAATVIGRRAQGHKARRREGVARTRPEDRTVRATDQAGPSEPRVNTGSRHRPGTRGTESRPPGRARTRLPGRATVTPAPANSGQTPPVTVEGQQRSAGLRRFLGPHRAGATAIQDERLAGHVPGTVGGQVGDCGGDVVGVA